MKKKIGFVPMDPVLGAWLLEMLAKHPPESENVGELCSGIQDLLRGEVTSLLLSAAGEGEAPTPAESLQLGELEIFPKSRRDILWFLAQNRGEVFTKEQIYRAVWSDNYLLDDSNIMAFIRKLRKKIEPDPDAPHYILTIWGIGYKFNDLL